MCAQFLYLYRVGAPLTDLSFVVQNFSVISWHDALMMDKPLKNEMDRLSLCGHGVALPRENVDLPWHNCDPQSCTRARVSILVRSFTLIVLLVLYYVSAAECAMPQVFSAGGCK